MTKLILKRFIRHALFITPAVIYALYPSEKMENLGWMFYLIAFSAFSILASILAILFAMSGVTNTVADCFKGILKGSGCKTREELGRVIKPIRYVGFFESLGLILFCAYHGWMFPATIGALYTGLCFLYWLLESDVIAESLRLEKEESN